jgi:anti-sigma factor RsiW
MIELQTECAQSGQIHSFLANQLDAAGRHDFLAHVAVCEACASLLRDLREDERLARMPLTVAEKSQIRAIVEHAREQVGVRLEKDRQRREGAAEPKPPAAIPPPGLALSPTASRRVLWLAIAAALALAAAGWWFFWA